MSDTISKFYIHRGSTSSNLSLYQDYISGDQSSWVDPTPLSGTNWYKLFGITMTGQIIDSGLPTPVSRGFPSGPQWVTQLYFPDPVPSLSYFNFYKGLQVNGSALDSSGNLYVCGHGDPYGSGQNPLYIAKYSSAGAMVWQKYLFGTLQKSECTDIVIDKDGNLLITGWCCGHIDFGGGVKEASGSGDPFVLKLSPTAGAYIWSTIFTGGGAGFVGDMQGTGIATDNTGAIWVTGTYVGNVTVNHSDFPGATGNVLLTQIGAQDIFLAKLLTDGSVSWAKKFGSAFTEEHGNGIAVDPATGASFITGTFNGTVDFSQGTGTPLTSNSAQLAPFVAKFDTSGASLASIAFQVTGSGTLGSDGPTGGRKCRLDASGNLVVGGVFKNTTITIGSTTFTNKGPDGTIDIFVTKLNSSTLNPSWAFSCGSNTSDNFYGLAIDSNGNILFTGLFWRTMDVGSIHLSTVGIFDTYIAKLSPAGVAISAIGYGSANQVSKGTTLAISPSGPVYVGLIFGGPITFSTTVSLPTPTPSNSVNGAILATVL